MNNTKIEMIGVGSPVVDLIAEVTDEVLLSVPGKKGGMELVDTPSLQKLLGLVSDLPVKAAGGSAGNTTFALGQMGIRCAFMGKLGQDENGEYYQTLFRELGGDISRFKTDSSGATACCISFVTPDSERTMRTDLGAAMRFSPADLSPADFEGCGHVHVEGYLLFNRELLMAVLKSAKSAGSRVSLDLGSFEVVEAAKDILPEILEHYVDLVFANEEEAEVFCGDSDPKKGLMALGELCEIAAVKIGRDGAWLKDGRGSVHVPAFLTDKAIDTTGAGDFWAAGFLYGHLRGHSLAVCGRIGALLGKHVVQYLGASLPHVAWDEIMNEIKNIIHMKEEKAC